MSNHDKPISKQGTGALSDRFHRSVTVFHPNKPDFKELDLGSPISPLPTHRSATAAATGLSTTTTTTNSTSSSGGSVSCWNASSPVSGRSENAAKSRSGESPVCSPPIDAAKTPSPGHWRSVSSGASLRLIYSGGSSSASSPPPPNVSPTGNICPSGKVLTTGMSNRSSRSDVLGHGTVNYGHGSIMRGCISGKMEATSGLNLSGRVGRGPSKSAAEQGSGPEELKRLGNEQYKRGNFEEALSLYDRAVSLSPGNAAYRSNRAAALTGLGRLSEAVRDCEEAIRLEPGYGRAHQRLASLLIRLGLVEPARRHLCIPGQQPDQSDLHKLQTIEKHLNKCSVSRKVGDWRSVLKEVDAAIATGAEFSSQFFACRAEALLKLHQLDEASYTLSSVPKFESRTQSLAQTKSFGMVSEAYLFFVRAQIEMMLGRFESAITAAERAEKIDPQNVEVSVLLKNARLVARSHARGNDLFKSERFTESAAAYGEGLRLNPSISVLYCNRAACWYKIGLWEQSVKDCNQALQIQPNYTKALLRRAASNAKLEQWVDAVRDYQALRRELPRDNEIAESLFHAQVAMKKSRGEDISNMKFGGEVEEVLGLDQFQAAISSPGVSVVHFKCASNAQCEQMSLCVDSLCSRYPSINFLKVDVDENPVVASTENVRIASTIKIYKNGVRLKDMICPSPQMLESSLNANTSSVPSRISSPVPPTLRITSYFVR